MSKTLTAEEKELELIQDDLSLITHDKSVQMIIFGLCKRYHKAKVESITDDEIEKITNTKYNGYFVNYRKPFLNGAKWLKQKLLKQ